MHGTSHKALCVSNAIPSPASDSAHRRRTLVPKRRTEANPQTAAQLDAQIAATDRQIDRLVYDLYGLTEDEIALVEGA